MLTFDQVYLCFPHAQIHLVIFLKNCSRIIYLLPASPLGQIGERKWAELRWRFRILSSPIDFSTNYCSFCSNSWRDTILLSLSGIIPLFQVFTKIQDKMFDLCPFNCVRRQIKLISLVPFQPACLDSNKSINKCARVPYDILCVL